MFYHQLCAVVVATFVLCFIGRSEAQLDTHRCNAMSIPCLGQGVTRCIPQSWICDGYSDCDDNMDENSCFYEETNCTAAIENAGKEADKPIIQCGATKCLAESSNLMCNGVIDCRGYNGTYVYAEYGVDESPDYCRSATTSTVAMFKSSMGWQPDRWTSYKPQATYDWQPLTITDPPKVELTTVEYFWKTYCRRQVSINYCPRRCVLRGLCAPLRINPSRWELTKMKAEMNPPVVGPAPKTPKPATTPAPPTRRRRTTLSNNDIRKRLMSENDLLERIKLDEHQNRQNEMAVGRNMMDNSGNFMDSFFNNEYGATPRNSIDGGKKKKRNSPLDSNMMANPNTVYDWSDDSNYPAPSCSITSTINNLLLAYMAINLILL